MTKDVLILIHGIRIQKDHESPNSSGSMCAMNDCGPSNRCRYTPGVAAPDLLRKSAFLILSTVLPSLLSGCSDCDDPQSDFAFYRGDRCHLVLESQGRLFLSPSPIVAAPQVERQADEETTGGGEGDSSEVQTVVAAATAYIDSERRLPADNHLVNLSLGSCSDPPAEVVGPEAERPTYGLPHPVTDYAKIYPLEEEKTGTCETIATGSSLRCFLAARGVAEFAVRPGAFETPGDKRVCLWAVSGPQEAKTEVIITAGIKDGSSLAIVADSEAECSFDGECRLAAPVPGVAACSPTGTQCGMLHSLAGVTLRDPQGGEDSVNFMLQGEIRVTGATSVGAWLDRDSGCSRPRGSTSFFIPEGSSRSLSVRLCAEPRRGSFELRAEVPTVDALSPATRTINVPPIPHRVEFAEQSRLTTMDGNVTYTLSIQGMDCDNEPFSIDEFEISVVGDGVESVAAAADKLGHRVTVELPAGGDTTLVVEVPSWEVKCTYEVLAEEG